MLDHIDLYRGCCLGSFRDLLLEVTRDPAMLLFLNGANSDKNSPNENYGREIMELFSLGADRGAYTEDDVRQAARALTGWRAELRQRRRLDELPLRALLARLAARRRSSAGRATSTGATSSTCA